MFPSDGATLASGDSDGPLRTDVAAERPPSTLPGHQSGVRCLAYLADERILISGGRDHCLRLWDLENGEELGQFNGHRGPITSLAFSPRRDASVRK